MGIIGCGIMVAGLVAGALFLKLGTALMVVAAGLLLVAAASWREHKREEAAKMWQAAYPPYGY